MYAGNDLDRGHLARRSDLLWGTLDEARAANEDSFFFTNIAPQMNDFNQSGLDGVWGLLEDAVLEQAGLERRRLTLFGGPVLTDADVVHRGVLIPGAFWKVVVYVLDGTLSARCFVLAQEVDPLRVAVTLDDFATYEVSLNDLEALLSLTFEVAARAVGRRTDGGAAAADQRRARNRLVTALVGTPLRDLEVT